jgi:hypothetical protein
MNTVLLTIGLYLGAVLVVGLFLAATAPRERLGRDLGNDRR